MARTRKSPTESYTTRGCVEIEVAWIVRWWTLLNFDPERVKVALVIHEAKVLKV